jgi:hypothetical protein
MMHERSCGRTEREHFNGTQRPLALASVATVSAGSPCAGYAREYCEQMAADDAIIYDIEAASATHILPVNGIGQEHCEKLVAQCADA